MQKILGIEFGSTRIKAVLCDERGRVLAQGGYGWENRRLAGGVWSYRLADAVEGMQTAYAELKRDFAKRKRGKIAALDAIGVSGMMHGYLPFDENGRQLAEFRTWRCTVTAPASAALTKAFGFTIPQRWSVAHLYQRVLDGGREVKDIAFLTTLAGYAHFLLTGEKVLGLGEASGMFPVDARTRDYDAKMLKTFDALCAKRKCPWRIRDILPKTLSAGEVGGFLTERGAKLLDPSGELAAGALLAPPEGDVQTGMVATNAVGPGEMNVSAGTSVFGTAILAKPLRRLYPEIDIVNTPTGAQAAMSHANTCTSDINAWVKLLGGDYEQLFRESLKGAPDCAGVVTVPYLSGEPIVHMDEALPLVARLPGADFTRANFMRASIYSSIATMRIGLDLVAGEGLKLTKVTAHGGLFKTPKVAQQYLADALGAPVTCMATAGEGGAWGMALLAAFAARSAGKREKGKGNGGQGAGNSLEEYLAKVVFKGAKGVTLKPNKKGAKGFAKYLVNFQRVLRAIPSIIGQEGLTLLGPRRSRRNGCKHDRS